MVNLVGHYDGFVFDLDGTVYLGESLLPGAFETINAIREQGKRIVYLTNKPLDPTAVYASKLSALGLPTAARDVIGSIDSLISYMAEHHPGASVYCVTEPLVQSVLEDNGHRVVPGAAAETAQVVVVSFDRGFDYSKLLAAYRAVRAGARIVATNPDPYCPTPDGGLPDCAAMLAAIEAATGAKAEAVLGKPSPAMASAVLERIDLPPSRILLTGDRAETDVVMGARAGMDTALVLTGATDVTSAGELEPAPTYILASIGEMLTTRPQSTTAAR